MKSLPVLISIVAGTTLASSYGCASRDQVSPAYQSAVDQAFADLKARETEREPASQLPIATNAFASKTQTEFAKTQSFEVMAYPKLAKLSKTNRDPEMKIRLGEPVTFKYRIDRKGHCALGAEILSKAELENCVQIEIKPTDLKQSKQFVRVFMTPDYHVYGVSFHDLNKQGQAKNRRRLVKWDLAEPLSSDVLASSTQLVPLDLPAHASNALKSEKSAIKIANGSRAGETCEGRTMSYHNVFGALVQSSWCAKDPWPTVVETDRYVAYLKSGAN